MRAYVLEISSVAFRHLFGVLHNFYGIEIDVDEIYFGLFSRLCTYVNPQYNTNVFIYRLSTLGQRPRLRVSVGARRMVMKFEECHGNR